MGDGLGVLPQRARRHRGEEAEVAVSSRLRGYGFLLRGYATADETAARVAASFADTLPPPLKLRRTELRTVAPGHDF
jgi:hypothetical protein